MVCDDFSFAETFSGAARISCFHEYVVHEYNVSHCRHRYAPPPRLISDGPPRDRAIESSMAQRLWTEPEAAVDGAEPSDPETAATKAGQPSSVFQRLTACIEPEAAPGTDPRPRSVWERLQTPIPETATDDAIRDPQGA